MFQITILSLYMLAALAFALSRLPRHASRARLLFTVACGLTATGLFLHGESLILAMLTADGLNLSIGIAASIIAFQLALIGLLGVLDISLRGMSAGLLILAALALVPSGAPVDPGASTPMTWQTKVHVLISLFAYGLLTTGAIVALFALIQDRRLRAGRISSVNLLFAPLETTEKLLFGVATAGFIGLLMSVVSGFAFVENLFAQHLVHKTGLSLLALVLFGILVAGRFIAGWRGRRAVYLYLWGFGVLCLAYFGTRLVLEELLGRSWG